jgi:hypothetical protein
MTDVTGEGSAARSGRHSPGASASMPTSGLLRLDKPIGTLLLLWPTLSALWLASFGRAFDQAHRGLRRWAPG